MNDIVIKDNIGIENLIYEIRGKQVMLDSDLAMLYGCKNGTKEINQAVKNNIEKFPERYSFKLTDDEYTILRSKFLTANVSVKSRTSPRVFTEQGIYMLATVLKSKTASEMTIAIMDTFVIMRKYLIANDYTKRLSILETKLLDLDDNIKQLQESFDKISTKQNNNHIFYEGQIYDAYSLLIDILSKAKEEIIIIDNYAGKELFDITRNININIKIYTKNIDIVSKRKYEKEYSNIKIISTDIFHDRFIIIDNKKLYHSGSSFKDLGKRCFAISKIEDISLLKELLNKLMEVN